MGDRVRDEPALEPDLCGVSDPDSDEILYWSPRNSRRSKNSRVLLPVALGDDWTEIMARAATYGRSMFHTDFFRVFAVVLGINYAEKNLRFLIFHRGGLTSHRELALDKREGREAVLRLIMTLLLWSDPTHAGLMSVSNEVGFLLPGSSGSPVLVAADKVIHDSTCIRGRGTRVFRLSCDPPNGVPVPRSSATNLVNGTQNGEEKYLNGGLIAPIIPNPLFPLNLSQWSSPINSTHIHSDGKPNILKASWQVDERKDTETKMYAAADGAFGTPAVVCSFEGTHPNGSSISDSLLLPTAQDLESGACRYLSIFTRTTVSPIPERRTLYITVFDSVGQSLIHAESSYDFCIALVHSLLGWLSYYQTGFLHRDVSIGNVLLAVGGSRTSKTSFSVECPASSSSNDQGDSVQAYADSIRDLARNLNIKSEFAAFITDGDMAVDWRTYFENNDHKTKYGTPEFMSLAIHNAVDLNMPYLHSPIDDLESFFWVSLWAVLLNKHVREPSALEIKLKADIVQARFELKASIVMRLEGSLLIPAQHSTVGNALFPLLRSWWLMQRVAA
ncbi:hypothetical protein R3P38DRAFT_2828966 [Favolaschia claudopus]|uniref:Fungal-type protein kinase domain-containing protein n=1 Tax=Favolaschia claudopus TaxID=2862362 RepID=A0AAW0E705_9AGAR